MKAFHAVRQHAAKKGWPATFVTSGGGKYASCFIDLHREIGDGDPSKRVLLETHGTPQEAGLAMRKHLLNLGLMQRGPGAPKGNRNAVAANRVGAADRKRAMLLKKIIQTDIRDENVYSAPLVINDNMLLTAYLEGNVGLYGGPVGETLEEANLRVAAESMSKSDLVLARAKPVNGATVRLPYTNKRVKNTPAIQKALAERRPFETMQDVQNFQNRMNAQVLREHPDMVARIKADVAKRTIDGVVVKKITMKPALPATAAPKRSHHKKKA